MLHIPESGGEAVPDEEEPPLKPQPSPELTPELLLLICGGNDIHHGGIISKQMEQVAICAPS